MTKDKPIGPGEARTRQRQRRQFIYIAVAGLAGGLIGFLTGFFDQGEGNNNMFSGNWQNLQLDPAVAIGLALALVGAFVVYPIYGFTQIDELKREQNLIGFAGSAIATLAAYPIWVTLYGGGLAPPPTAFGLFMVSLGGMLVAFIYAKFRV